MQRVDIDPALRGQVLLLLHCEQDTDHAGEQSDTLDESGADDHRRTNVTSVLRLAAAGFKSSGGQTANTGTHAKNGDANAEDC